MILNVFRKYGSWVNNDDDSTVFYGEMRVVVGSGDDDSTW